jgi:hypothetical protein
VLLLAALSSISTTEREVVVAINDIAGSRKKTSAPWVAYRGRSGRPETFPQTVCPSVEEATHPRCDCEGYPG